MGLLLKQAYMLDPNGKQLVRDILVENGKIIALEEQIADKGHREINCRNKWVFPGFIDVHVHLREPGFEAKETLETGTRAAARGGFTTIFCMPNTKPSLDRPELIKRVMNTAARKGAVHVQPIAAITKNQQGEELTDFAALKEAGAAAFSDDGVGVQSSYVMKQAMIKAKALDLPIVAHCEDDTLAAGGVVHEGVFSKRHGLPGIPSDSEYIHVGRDILLAEETGAQYHVCHISTKESVRLVREGKQRGVKVTAEVAPHHLLLCDEDIPCPDPNFKMNPPLRSKADRQAVVEGLVDGTIDIIATDHAPHTEEEKSRGIIQAPFGIVGLETAFPLLYTHLVKTGTLTLAQLIEKMTAKPAEIFGLNKGRLEIGADADLTVVDLELEQPIRPEHFLSKGRNTPFAGWICQGWPVATIVNGEVVWQEQASMV
ncbi:dihydroorotase, multifunctional complex type [Caldalkalibacillus thermarum TA2.A1]|uniref:Dihydroorotase n=1 Tax=Caldalkalibacillus thermarum (strain TA2.A1) TaxID=986075 RepID=F5L6E8_CALTT|nr:dihydroorotase [Caldalkalibacillus thermarum]EGL83101.1 dihydroorotase, multifunctional complex type [Caldalkalibacillus thermarum TA2.A1]